jgi:hypothetical protein
VARWLGILLLLLLSVAISLLSQLERKRFRRRVLPEQLGEWVPEPISPGTANSDHAREISSLEAAPGSDTARRVREHRHLVFHGGLFSRTRLVEQSRVRDAISGEVMGDPTERVVDRWFELLQ